jgi:hypothetical protein
MTINIRRMKRWREITGWLLCSRLRFGISIGVFRRCAASIIFINRLRVGIKS